MADPFLGEVRMFGFNFAPRGWALCDGQLLPINQNQALFSILGTTYGGDGRTTFALPDLRGRTPTHVSYIAPYPQDLSLGDETGAETHSLTNDELPAHSHQVTATGDQGTDSSIDDMPMDRGMNTFASQSRGGTPYYSDTGALLTMHDSTVSNTGGSGAHNNMQPGLVVSFCIAMQGLFPSRS